MVCRSGQAVADVVLGKIVWWAHPRAGYAV